MSLEKKPRKVVAKKGVTKKSVDTAVTMTAAAAVEKAAVQTVAKPRVKAKSLQVNIDDIIRLRAYEIYLRRGATPGDPHEDWDVAEREVRAHFGGEAEA